MKITYITILSITATLFVYYIKLYADTNMTKYLIIAILNGLLTIISARNLFQDKSVTFNHMTIYSRALPIILLFLMDIIILKNKINFYKVLGVIIIIIGIFTMQIKNRIKIE